MESCGGAGCVLLELRMPVLQDLCQTKIIGQNENFSMHGIQSSGQDPSRLNFTEFLQEIRKNRRDQGPNWNCGITEGLFLFKTK
ncbi:hypothetical protein CRE_20887 [Caenorhabditis remanei]|uniref:Uncharacterized protein n=1 Tax=Caenorhabditis remanei TaxID=31234 RepID=E3MV46_CAERE|nr:hypothetical protein CRE_20887 [Caenorhabditis remanei]